MVETRLQGKHFFEPRSFDPDSGRWHSHTDETWDSARLYEDLHFDHFVSCALLWLWRLWFMMIKDLPAAAGIFLVWCGGVSSSECSVFRERVDFRAVLVDRASCKHVLSLPLQKVLE